MGLKKRFSQFIAGDRYTDGVPAAFFQHFPPDRRLGQAAVDEQIRFYRQTDMDMVKIMFDEIYPKIVSVKKPGDWRHIGQASRSDHVFTQQMEVAKRIVDKIGKETFVFQTIFSPFVSAGCAVSPILQWDRVVTDHMRRDPESMTVGLTNAAHVLSEFAGKIAGTGIDGFYVSLQGGEYDRFSGEFFNAWLKPLDAMLLNALKNTGKLVFLHICGSNIRLENYYDYPGDIVNLAFCDNGMTLDEGAKKFKRPVMGGLSNHGVICDGTGEEIKRETARVLSSNHSPVMLGADCTIQSNVPRDHLKWAVEAAHAFQQ